MINTQIESQTHLFAFGPPSPPPDDAQRPTATDRCIHETILGTAASEAMGCVYLGEASASSKLA